MLHFLKRSVGCGQMLWEYLSGEDIVSRALSTQEELSSCLVGMKRKAVFRPNESPMVSDKELKEGSWAFAAHQGL